MSDAIIGPCPTCSKCMTKCTCGDEVHVIPMFGSMEHIESKTCWCEHTLIQDIDDEHDKQVWSHKGYEELNQ